MANGNEKVNTTNVLKDTALIKMKLVEIIIYWYKLRANWMEFLIRNNYLLILVIT